MTAVRYKVQTALDMYMADWNLEGSPQHRTMVLLASSTSERCAALWNRTESSLYRVQSFASNRLMKCECGVSSLRNIVLVRNHEPGDNNNEEGKL
jgi:hypothetical protein